MLKSETMTDENWQVTRRRVLGAGASAGLTGLAGCLAPGQAVTDESTESFSVAGGTSVAVDNRNGDVRVERGEDDDVTVEVRKQTRFDRSLLDRVAVEGTEDEGVLTIQPTYEGDAVVGRVRVRLTVRVPETVPLANASTENGDVVAEGVTGDATLQTVNGDAEARGVSGYVTLRSSNGRVLAREVAGVDGAATTNGDVDVAITDLRQDATLESTNGDVEAGLGPELATTVEARTANGDAEVRDLRFEDEQRSERRVSGTLNGGGPTLTARTVNGDVVLYAL